MPRPGIILVLALSLSFALDARGGGAGSPRHAAESMPADLDLIAVVDNAAALRRTEAGPGLEALSRALLSPEGAMKKWSLFARSIGLTEAEAFDAIFGARVVVVASDLWGDRSQWALLAEVSRDTERRLRKTLRAAPRALVAGRAVYAVENGRFELTMQERGSFTHLLITRADDRALFDRLAHGLGDKAGRMRDTEPMAQLARLENGAQRGRPDGLVYLRLPPGVGGWAGALVWQQKGLLGASIVARSERPLPPGAGVSPAMWKAFSRDALIAVMERRPALDRDQRREAPALLRGVPFFDPSDEIEAALADVVAVAVRGAPEGVHISCAIQTVETSRAAAPLDRMASDILVGVSGLLGVGAWDYDFDGAFPEAVRDVTLAGKSKPGLPLMGPGFRLAWTFRPDPGVPDRGWMILSTAPQDLPPIVQSLEAPVQDATKPWLTVGVLRPAELHQVLSNGNTPLPPAAESLKWVDVVHWRIHPAQDGLLFGEAGMKLRPSP